MGSTWKKHDELFGEALDRPTDERSHFLEEACGADPELRKEIEALLTDEARAGELFAQPIENLAETAASLTIEQKIGPYRLIRILGSGGMAIVYLAEREEGIPGHRVAIKMLQDPGRRGDLRRRFEQEQQILGSLRHRNIARLYDAGTTEQGHSFLIMEYVEGLRVDHYCDEHRLGVEARIRLFLEVCEAVHHAHQSLLIHRDLKPANILVTESGAPKLLDFGIAKPLVPDLAGDDALTRTGMTPMTLRYASPEQVRAGRLTTASDVYALGVLLYELLSGSSPYAAHHQDPVALSLAIAEAAPVPPSRAVAGHRAMASLRSSQPRALAQHLSGDLDCIVMKALRKEPTERYATVDQLMQDLHRYLAREPVEARRGNWIYRASKMVSRNPVATILSLVIVLLVSVSSGVLAMQNTRLMAEQTKAERMWHFMRDLFEVSEPDRARGESITARELLDRAAQNLETQALDEEPAVRADMMRTIGLVYAELGLYPESERLLDGALAIRRSRGDPVEIARGLFDLGTLLRTKRLYQDALPYLREALSLRESTHGPNHSDVAATLHELAIAVRGIGDYDEAERLLRRAIASRRGLPTDHRAEIAQSEATLAELLRQDGRLQEARPLFERAIATDRQLGRNDLTYATTTANYGLLLGAIGQSTEAVGLMRESLKISQAFLGLKHPQTMMARSNLAGLYLEAGDVAEAKRLIDVNLDLIAATPGISEYMICHSLFLAARVEHGAGRLTQAQEAYRTAFERARTHFGEQHPLLSHFWLWWGRLLVEVGRPAEAEARLVKAIDNWLATVDPNNERIDRARGALGAALAAQGRDAEAKPLLDRGFKRGFETDGGHLEFTRWLASHLRLFCERMGCDLPDNASTILEFPEGPTHEQPLGNHRIQ